MVLDTLKQRGMGVSWTDLLLLMEILWYNLLHQLYYSSINHNYFLLLSSALSFLQTVVATLDLNCETPKFRVILWK